MKILKTFISLLLCVLMVAPMAILPSFAQSDSELKGYIDAAEKLLYSGGTASSRRQLKAAYDISITALESQKSLTKDKEEAIELISKAIEDFVPVESFDRVYVAGFDVWNADTVKSFTDTSGCAVFFDTFTVPEGAKSSVKVVTAGSDTAFFSNEGADGGIIGENPLLGDLTNSGGLRIWTSINDVSLAESMSVSVGVRNAQKHTTFTAHNIPVINGYSTIDWEFFTPEYDGVGESIDTNGSLNYIAITFKGVKANFIAYISDLHCFANDVLLEEGTKYQEILATEITSGKYYKLVERESGKALAVLPETTDTERETVYPNDNRISVVQNNLSLGMQERKESATQEWQIYDVGNGSYRIINRDNSLFLKENSSKGIPELDEIDLEDKTHQWILSPRDDGGFMISTLKSRLSRLCWNGRKLSVSNSATVWDIYECYRGEWKEVWSDEFEGDEIDRDKWSIFTGGRYDTAIYYTDEPNNAKVENGNLVISTHIEEREGYPATSAYMTTEGRFLMTYGKIEMRAKLPKGNNIWPALWMMGVYGNWPHNGEIDIMELVGGDIESGDYGDSLVFGTLHWLSDWDDRNEHTQKGVSFFTPGKQLLNDEYHTFTAEWEQDQLRIYYDGMQYVSLNLNEDGMKWGYGDNPHYLILSQGLRLNDGKLIDGTASGAEYMIDYVRVSKRTSDMTQGVSYGEMDAEIATENYADLNSAYVIETSPNGKYFTTTGFRGNVFQIDSKTGEMIHSFPEVTEPLTALKYSESGKYLAAASRSGQVIMIKSEDLTNKRIGEVYGLYIEALEFSPDESLIYIGGRNDNVDGTYNSDRVYVYGTSDVLPVTTIDTGSHVRSISASKDGLFVAAGTSDGYVRIYNAEDYSEYASFNMGGTVRNVKFFDNSAKIVASNEIGQIAVYDVSRKELAYYLDNTDAASVAHIAISPDETKVVASSSDNNARLFDLNTGRLISVLGGFDQMVSSVDFSDDGSRIAVGSYDGTARVYDAHGGLIKCLKLSEKYNIHRNLEAIKFSNDSRKVLAVAVSHNENSYIWDLPISVNKTPLKNSVIEAMSIDKSLYTKPSIDRLTVALQESNPILAKVYVSDAEISECVKKIKNAMYELELIPGGEVVLNGFEKWTSDNAEEMTAINGTVSIVTSETALTPNVTKAVCFSASTTRVWRMYNYDSDKQLVGQNPFGADLSNSDGICFWAKGVTKSQENGRVCIGYTGTEGSFMFEANLPTITTEGLYVKIPFSAFTHVSGEETLDLKKLNTIGFYGKGEKGMFIFTELTAYSEVGEAPVISGVDEGASYDITNGEAPKASWDNGFATLDGNVYEKGTPITEAGEHTLTVNNRGTQVSVSFSVVDNTADPIISGVRDREVFDIAKGESVSASWDVGEGELNGEAVSSVAISEVGEYTLTVRNGYKSESVYFVVIDTSADVPMYIKGDFDGDEKITVADALAALRIAARIAECSDTELLIGDIDADGEITVADALAILRVAAKMSDSL